jgi:hypothetical protein
LAVHDSIPPVPTSRFGGSDGKTTGQSPGGPVAAAAGLRAPGDRDHLFRLIATIRSD